MRRYQYRLNDQNISQAGWGVVTPLKYIETVPGETYAGTFSVNAGTGLTSKMIKSRAYYDLYAFYCPIRLLWEQFPDFLASKEGEMQPPQTTTLFPQNFENDFVGGDGTTDTNSALLRRMYYMCAMSFFATSKQADGSRDPNWGDEIRAGDFDNTTWLQTAEARSSTFDESWLSGEAVQSQQIISVASGQEPNRFMVTNLDDIRRAYTLDRWEKMRDYYGSRYTDLLKSYGVKADWGILQEAECIGISNNDFNFKPRSSSGDTNFGDRRGFFEGEYKLKIRKTFSPEHGIIAVFAVARADIFNQTQGSHILATRDLKMPGTFWDPISWDGFIDQSVPMKIIDKFGTAEQRARSPLGEHLRKGRNEMALPYDADFASLPVSSKTMSSHINDHNSYLVNACTPSKSDFQDNDWDVTHYTECRLTKRSPVKPSGTQLSR